MQGQVAQIESPAVPHPCAVTIQGWLLLKERLLFENNTVILLVSKRMENVWYINIPARWLHVFTKVMLKAMQSVTVFNGMWHYGSQFSTAHLFCFDGVQHWWKQFISNIVIFCFAELNVWSFFALQTTRKQARVCTYSIVRVCAYVSLFFNQTALRWRDCERTSCSVVVRFLVVHFTSWYKELLTKSSGQHHSCSLAACIYKEWTPLTISP